MVGPWLKIIKWNTRLLFSLALMAPMASLAKNSKKENDSWEHSPSLKLLPEVEREALNESECGGQIDLSKNFSAVRDQKGLGLCSSFVTAALIEEHLCIHDPSLCGIMLSELHISLADWDLGTDEVGAHSYNVLKTVFNSQGVCEAKYNPYPNLSSLGCSLTGKDSASCMVDKLVSLYNANHALSVSRPEAIKWSSIQKILGDNFDQEALLMGLMADDEGREFLKAALISKQCQENLIPASDLPAADVFKIETLELVQDAKKANKQFYVAQEKFSWKAKYNLITYAMNQGRSVGISLCSKLMLSLKNPLKKNLSNFINEDCGEHAVVLTGKRWNDQKKQCEFNVRNSWGDSDILSGWTSADKILSSTYRLTWLEDH